MPKTQTFNIETLTLGELAMVEEASGLPYSKLFNVGGYRLALAAMVLASRSGEPVPSWDSLMNRPVLGSSSSTSASEVDSPGQK